MKLCRATTHPLAFVGDFSSPSRNRASCLKILLPCSSSSSSSAGGSETPIIPSISFQPLFERRLCHRYTAREVLAWAAWAQSMAAAVGDKFREADGGPSSEELLKELEWMVEDGFSMRWRELKSSAHAADQASKAVLSRARLEELSVLWSQRVGERRPFQYVVGCAHWRDYVLCVREGVLIPRPETEQMIDIAQEVLASNPGLGKGLWLDLGTGSGALAIGLGHLLLHPESVILAIDISLDALSFAALNVRRYGLQNKVKVMQGSWFSGLEGRRGTVAGVLSNPPYIPSPCIRSLQAEVGRYEPHKALDGGEQGTDDLNAICDGAAWALQKDGCLILETNGGGQAEMIAACLERGPFYDVQLVKDYAGIVRFVKALHV